MAAEIEYTELRFISTTAVETWTKPKDATIERETDYNYTIVNNTITLTYAGEEQIVINGTIEGKTMTFTNLEGANPTMVFTKQ
jgi:hypothetical protein